jgi:hypothetical protein
MSCFASANIKTVAFPVNIVQRQRSDFTGPQAVGHQEQEDCIVALSNRTPPVDCQQHLLHFAPGDGARQIRQPVSTR